MSIPVEAYDQVRSIDIDEHRTRCAYQYWLEEFRDTTYVYSIIAFIHEALGEGFTRSELVDFYRRTDVQPETKFIAAMIWGHEAPAGSRRDSRGPWKLSKMFSDPRTTERAIRDTDISNPDSLVRSYKLLDKTLDRCGPNFFTKHFYFLGKASGLRNYPLIFDDRVATGLLKIRLTDDNPFRLVRVSAQRSPEAYLLYLNFAHSEADKIGVEPDKVEYFLFNQ